MYIYLLLLCLASAERFAIIGDYGQNTQGELAVSNLIKKWDTSSRLTGILTTGDNNYNSGSQSTIEKNIGKYYSLFMYPYISYSKPALYSGAIDKINRFYPTPGNHDWGNNNLNAYLNYFKVNRYYNKAFNNSEIFMLDSDSHEPDGVSVTSKQALWLKNGLKASKKKWKLILFHHPPYSSGEHGNNVYMSWPFYDWGASLVISGHDHDYERIIIKNNTYLVNGLGGAEIRSFKKNISGSVKRYNKNYGALLIEITDKLKIQFISIDNIVQDSYILLK